MGYDTGVFASAALWVFAPLGVAQVGSIAAVGAGGVVVAGYSWWKHIACRKSANCIGDNIVK